MYKKSVYLLLLLVNIGCSRIHTFSGQSIDPDELDLKVKAAMDSLDIPGMSLAIINDGRIVYNQTQTFGYANPANG